MDAVNAANPVNTVNAANAAKAVGAVNAVNSVNAVNGVAGNAAQTQRVQRSQRSQRAPKQDRSRATRQRLLEAAVACLAEYGWAGSTVSVVAERAGVSRGAAQHHFPTREDLFTAAVEYVAEERSTALRALFPEGAADRRAVVAALVDLYTGPLFRAALHLWVAASNEEQLRPRVTELEARVGRETHRIAVELLSADESRPGVRETVQGLLDMSRGLGLANLLTDDGGRRERVVAQWAALLDASLN
ncbi:TetR/AcrR family transcriptional regulator [Streptomyces sp. WI04-05B]|uniref:TetR/AcrR family transcriptional regulator n=1 Tax=Streptomyces TaxID=1883 RepID=UPI0029B0A33C|nr:MULTISPECIES: TetR/AcrR family transcriptional regulator [unclassified Streptomyces]MDX2545223.1 TetR/AcrR family transcriptional regulator [Streptomyces sp. WI04-05B]MDX2587337.1 TetR/AcrR family transcriptional regulator [Streptomyces sp. WI04-05A]